MRQRIIPLLLAAIGSSASAAGPDNQSYYDYEGPGGRMSRPAPAAAPAGPRKSFVVEGESGTTLQSARPIGKNTQDGAVTTGQSAQPALPPNMDRGVKDLESGMEDLRAYTAVMAAHVQQNGMRGFLAVPSDIRDQGLAVGRKIGGGINGIMTDAAQDMIVPEKR